MNDDVLRAGWRRNEPGPYWEQAHELEPDRRAITKIDEGEGDGFDMDEVDLDESSPDSLQDQGDLMDALNEDGEAGDELGSLPGRQPCPDLFADSRHGLAKTQSMPVGGTFGSRPDQPKFYRPFDDTFMKMDVPF